MRAHDHSDEREELAAAADELARVVRVCLADGLTVEEIGLRLGIPPQDVEAIAARD